MRSIYGKYTGVRARRVLVLNKSAAKLTRAATPPSSPLALRASGAEPSTRFVTCTESNSEKRTIPGSRKRFAKQRFFGKRSRNGENGRIAKASRPKAKFTATTERGAALNRLRHPRAFPVRGFSVFIRFGIFGFQLLFGIFAMTSLLTLPLYSPSSQQPKSSYRSSF